MLIILIYSVKTITILIEFYCFSYKSTLFVGPPEI